MQNLFLKQCGICVAMSFKKRERKNRKEEGKKKSKQQMKSSQKKSAGRQKRRCNGAKMCRAKGAKGVQVERYVTQVG